MLSDELREIKKRTKLRPIEERLKDYIEFAYKTKKFSDAGFYEEVLDYIERNKEESK